MNWTAILALGIGLFATVGALIFAWACNDACASTVERVGDMAARERDEHDEEMGKLNHDYVELRKLYEDAERRARRRQSKSIPSSRGTERDANA